MGRPSFFDAKFTNRASRPDELKSAVAGPKDKACTTPRAPLPQWLCSGFSIRLFVSGTIADETQDRIHSQTPQGIGQV